MGTSKTGGGRGTNQHAVKGTSKSAPSDVSRADLPVNPQTLMQVFTELDRDEAGTEAKFAAIADQTGDREGFVDGEMEINDTTWRRFQIGSPGSPMTEWRAVSTEPSEEDLAKAAASKAAAAEAYGRNAVRDARQDDPGESTLSYWADSLTGAQRHMQAAIDENGGYAAFNALFDAETNERVNAKLIDGQYGMCWAHLDDQGKFTGQFTKAFPKRESTMLKKGFVEGREFAPAGAALRGAPGARGLSGATSVHPVTYRKDGW